MKRPIVLLCIAVCLLLVTLPVASAKVTPTMTCPGKVVPGIVTTVTEVPGPYGTIYVESSPPGAVVSVNGENYGRSPATITDLWPGSYTVTAEMAGYQKYTTVTTISGRTRTAVYCTLIPETSGTGLYIISTPAGANVNIDGVSKGITPVLLRDIVAGNHTLQITLSGYPEWKSTVEAPTGGIRTVTAILKETGTDLNPGLNISSNPQGATIKLDSLEKGVTPKILNNIAPGIHILEMAYTGYTPWKSTIDVPETGIREITINLTPNPANAPGWITVVSDPDNASVTLDGNYVGRTSAGSCLNLDARPPGEYALVLSLPGYTSYSTRVTVMPNNVSAVNVTLVPVSGSSAKGALSVTSQPDGATVLLDNESIGTTPFSSDDIPAGNHRVTVRLNGYQDYSSGILVTPGTPRNVSAALQRSNSSLYAPLFPLTTLAGLGIAGLFALRKFH
jgi:hypothetical protein